MGSSYAMMHAIVGQQYIAPLDACHGMVFSPHVVVFNPRQAHRTTLPTPESPRAKNKPSRGSLKHSPKNTEPATASRM